MNPNTPQPTQLRPLSRRRLLGGVAGGAVIAASGSLLSACQSQESKAEVTGKTQTPLGRKLADLLGVEPGAAAGQGLTLQTGASLILSGALASLGKDHLRGLEIGVRHVREAGGPDIRLNVRDNGLDPTKGVANVRDFASTGCVAQFSDAAATLGSELSGYKDFKLFAIDPGGSIAAYAGSDYYYMTRPTPPDSYLPASAKFMRDRFPEARRWSLIGSDAGTDYNTHEIEFSRQTVEPLGFTFEGSNHVGFDVTDFAASLTKLRDEQPDIIQVSLYGDQLGVFLKQYAASGLKAELIGIDYTEGAQKIAAGSVERYFFGNDWFDPWSPTNEWAELLVEDYAKEYGEKPFYPAVQYYQAVFIMWQLVRDIIASDGDPTATGSDVYVEAVEAARTFPSILGGDGRRMGEFAFDNQHLPASLTCTLCVVEGDGQPEPLARFNVGGSTLTKA